MWPQAKEPLGSPEGERDKGGSSPRALEGEQPSQRPDFEFSQDLRALPGISITRLHQDLEPIRFYPTQGRNAGPWLSAQDSGTKLSVAVGSNCVNKNSFPWGKKKKQKTASRESWGGGRTSQGRRQGTSEGRGLKDQSQTCLLGGGEIGFQSVPGRKEGLILSSFGTRCTGASGVLSSL